VERIVVSLIYSVKAASNVDAGSTVFIFALKHYSM